MTRTAGPWAPRWMVELVGPDLFGHVRSVSVGPKTSEIVMSQIGNLQHVEEMSFSGTFVRPMQLRHLAQLKHLRELRLGDTHVTDDDLAQLSTLSSLEALFL